MTDTWSSEGPQCPHCGRQFTADEPFYYDEQGYTEQECDDCGKVFNVSVEATVAWSCRARSLEADTINQVESPSARITGDKGRENPAEGAPYGEGLIGRIDTLSSECQRLRTALQYIADLAYVDHESGNQNFECLQGIARGALETGPHISNTSDVKQA